MVATLCLFTCVLATSQAADRAEWQLSPRLGRAYELVYGGTFAEESLGKGLRERLLPFHHPHALRGRIGNREHV